MNHRSALFSASRQRVHLNKAAFLLAATAGIFSLMPTFSVAAESAAAPAPALKVTVTPVEVKLVTEFEEITGRVDVTETVDLLARVSGHLEEVHFSAGLLVKKGDILFLIDPRWYKAQFDLATARPDVATREAKRAEDLLAASALSSEEAESRRAKAAEARCPQRWPPTTFSCAVSRLKLNWWPKEWTSAARRSG